MQNLNIQTVEVLFAFSFIWTITLSYFKMVNVEKELKKFREDLASGKFPLYIRDNDTDSIYKELIEKIEAGEADKKMLLYVRQADHDDFARLYERLTGQSSDKDKS